ncbi:ABC transporter permease [Macrococcus equi]|uniref:ABC transporter permease n=1 Tax=Macrococcus equi TaxID=3395462 RepID=UPI0039BDAD92
MANLYFNLIKVGLKEIVRDKKLFFFISIFPLMFLIMFVILGKIIPASKFMTIQFDEFMFPGILIFALMGIGLYGTTAPLIEYRKNNTFKIFETTTLNKPIFILSLLSVRVIIGIFQISLFFLIGLFLKYININNIIPTFSVSIIILFIMITLGIFLGGIFNSSEIALGVLSFLSAPILMISNVLIPLDIFSGNFKDIAQLLPFAYMGDLLRDSMFTDYIHEYSYFKSLLVISISFVTLIIITIKTFKFYNKS